MLACRLLEGRSLEFLFSPAGPAPGTGLAQAKCTGVDQKDKEWADSVKEQTATNCKDFYKAVFLHGGEIHITQIRHFKVNDSMAFRI